MGTGLPAKNIQATMAAMTAPPVQTMVQRRR